MSGSLDPKTFKPSSAASASSYFLAQRARNALETVPVRASSFHAFLIDSQLCRCVICCLLCLKVAQPPEGVAPEGRESVMVL